MVNFIEFNPIVPPLPRIEDKKKINVRYMLAPPYTSAHIHWDSKINELVYDIEEPLLEEHEKEALKKLESAMLELININVAVDKTLDAASEYIDKTARLLIDELNLKIKTESYHKIFYYLFRDFIGLNELDPLLRDYFIEDIECNGVDTPVYIVHRVYRNIRTNLKYHDVEEIASFVEKLAQRTGRYVSYAQPLLDGALPDGSIDHHEPFIFKENGKIKIQNIGSFVDKHYHAEEANTPVSVNGFEVPAFDPKTLKLMWKKVDYVYRHKVNEKLYSLHLETGRNIRLTGSHSVFVVRKGGLVSEPTSNLKVGDYVAVPLRIPDNDCIKEINLAHELSLGEHASKISLGNVPDIVFEEKKEEIKLFLDSNYRQPYSAYYELRSKKILPLLLYSLLSEDELRKARIQTTSPVTVPTYLTIDKHLMRLLGYYISEGWLSNPEKHNNYDVVFCMHKDEREFHHEIIEAFRRCFGQEIYIEPEKNNAVKLKCNSYVIWHIFRDILEVGKYAKQKRIPSIIYNVNESLRDEFIRAYTNSDYGSSASELLLSDLLYIHLMKGKIISYSDRERVAHFGNRPVHSHEYYTNNLVRKQTDHFSSIPLEIFNPLNQTHHRLANKRIDRERLKNILADPRYERLRRVQLVNSVRFLREWKKRGLINENGLSESGKDLLKEIDSVQKLLESDLAYVKVRRIERVDASSPYVYDLSVEGHENFVGGFGGLCCHNSRVNATYTKDVTSRGPTFTIRKFTKIPWTPTQLITLNTLSPEMLAYFWILIQYKQNILISGGTASGKTTLLNALAFFIPPEARVVSIEDTREINLPRENWLPAVSRTAIGVGKVGEVDLFAILKNAFRQTPDYLIVGEVRGKEASVLFQGMASGHAAISTMHADSVDTLIRRLQTPPIELSPTLINSLDCVAIMTHAIVDKHETRRLREVVEIVNVNRDGTALINIPLKWDSAKDIFYFKKQSKVFERISARHGIPVEKLEKEFVTRSKLIYTLFQQKVFRFEEIQKIINDYYKNPVEVLSLYNITD